VAAGLEAFLVAREERVVSPWGETLPNRAYQEHLRAALVHTPPQSAGLLAFEHREWAWWVLERVDEHCD
jgi:hypothetical protein